MATPRGRPVSFLSVWVPVIAAVVSAGAVLYRASVPQEIRLVTDTQIELQNQGLIAELDALEKEMEALRGTKDRLEAQLAETEREQGEADAQLSEQTVDPKLSDDRNRAGDSWFVTVLKTFPVMYLLFFSAVATVFTLLGDAVGLIIGSNFGLTGGLWSYSWDNVTVSWYWERASWYGIALAIVCVVGGGRLGDHLESSKKPEHS